MVEKKILKNACVFPLPVVLYRQRKGAGQPGAGATRLDLKAKKEDEVATARAVRKEKKHEKIQCRILQR